MPRRPDPKSAQSDLDPHQAVAIVGLACRYPQAPNSRALWANMLAGQASFRNVEQLRWNHDLHYSPASRRRNSSYCNRAGFIEDVDLFAARYFDISPRRAEAMDPQQRLMLELAREALQDAGHEQRAFDRLHSAVFIGASVSEYASLAATKARARQLVDGEFGKGASDELYDSLTERLASFQSYTMPGSLLSMAATLVAQAFELGGPAWTLDAACASSLVAVLQGVSYLRSLPRELKSPVVLVGGVYLMLTPENMVCFARLGALARSECRPFDSEADGFILGEGAGLAVLKRLADAERDGDRIYAVIRGGASNNDGANSSPVAPRREGQEAVIRAGLLAAGVSGDSLGYLECHGTATRVGDATELAALTNGLGPSHGHLPYLGSAKANLGHSLTASGMAGLMRAALSLYYGRIPPLAGWHRWHPELEAAGQRFRVPETAADWPDQKHPRRASVSAFGFGGTNVYLVWEAAQARALPAPPATPVVLACTAFEGELLGDYLEQVGDRLAQVKSEDFAALAYTLTARRHIGEGLYLVARSAAEARARIGLWQNRERPHREAGLYLGKLEEGPARGEELGEDDVLLESVLEALSRGDDPAAFYPAEARRIVDAPLSPLARQSFWLVEGFRPGPRSPVRQLVGRE